MAIMKLSRSSMSTSRRNSQKKQLNMKKYAFSLLLALFALSFSHRGGGKWLIAIKGTTQGQFKGQETGKGGREKDGWFPVNSFEMGSASPVDPKSGRPLGKTTGKPFVVTKEVDAASPLLLNAHVNNESLESIVLQNIDDNNKVTKTITLTNALISEIKKNGTLESISFNFEKIEQKQ